MQTTDNQLIRITSAFIIISFLMVIIYLGSDIFSPLIIAFLFAVLLRPVVKFLNVKLRIPHLIAMVLTILIAVGVMFGVLTFMSVQISEFMGDIPELKKNLQQHLLHIQKWIQNTFGISYSMQKNYIENIVSASNVISTSSLSSITSGFLLTVLIPIYTFLILLYRSLFLSFLLKLFPKKDIGSIQNIITEIKTVIRSYITGLLVELLIVASMTALGFWIIGIDYFIFLGVLTALLNLIPYIGILIACTISGFIALANSADSSVIIGVVVVNVIVQFIDNNILVPKVVGSKVSINALASMIGVIIGGALAGISGMFLAIPMIAVMKVIFDRTPSLHAYGYLIGDDIPKTSNWKNIQLPNFNIGNSDKDKKDTLEENQ